MKDWWASLPERKQDNVLFSVIIGLQLTGIVTIILKGLL